MDDTLLTPEEVADWLKVKPRTITEWCRQEKIPHIKEGRLYRFKPESIRRWVQRKEKNVNEVWR